MSEPAEVEVWTTRALLAAAIERAVRAALVVRGRKANPCTARLPRCMGKAVGNACTCPREVREQDVRSIVERALAEIEAP